MKISLPNIALEEVIDLPLLSACFLFKTTYYYLQEM